MDEESRKEARKSRRSQREGKQVGTLRRKMYLRSKKGSCALILSEIAPKRAIERGNHK